MKSGYKARPIIDRFEEKIFYSPDGCWYWIGQVSKSRHPSHVRPKIKIGQSPELAYRFSYRHFKSEIPDGLCVLHTCDNPICVNPGHLFLGTKMDNTYDMMAKGRKPIGERHYKTQLTDQQAIDIISSNESNKSLCDKFNVAYSVVWSLRKRRTFKHLLSS